MKFLGYRIHTLFVFVVCVILLIIFFNQSNNFPKITEGLGPRYVPVTIPPPIPQNPALSYAPRQKDAPLGVTFTV